MVSTLRMLGAPVEQVFDRAGFSRAWLEAPPDALMPVLPMYRLYAEAARAAGTTAFGAIVGVRPATEIGTYGRIVYRSLTLLEAMRQSARLNPVQGGTHRIWLQDDPAQDAIWFCRDGLLQFTGGVLQLELYSLRLFVGLVRLVAGPAWKPDAIRFCAGKELGNVLDSIEPFQGVRAAIGQPWGGIRVPRALLGLELPRRNVHPEGVVFDDWLAHAPSETFVDSFRQLVESLLDVTGEPSVELAADAAGVHPRRLQRRLAVEGLSIRQVVDEMRYRRARALIDDRDRSLTDIAYDLGYSDPAHFTRAFRRWAGVAPVTYRRTRAGAAR